MLIFSNSNTRGTRRERALHMMFERYYMTVNEIHFPIPTGKLNNCTNVFLKISVIHANYASYFIGFHTFFVFMGFRCLEER